MKKILLVILAMTFSAGMAYADDSCGGCSPVKVWGYMAPNFRMIDKGEDNASNMGFGMAFCRFVMSGTVDGGPIVKKVSWRVETDIKQNSSHGLQWAYLQPWFTKEFSLKMGRVKMPFSREILHNTAKLWTVDRHVSSHLARLHYGGFSYGLEGHYMHEWVKVHAGVYDGAGAQSHVMNQDPALSFGARAVLTPPTVEGLEIGANVMMVTLPDGGMDQVTYVDSDSTEYMSNSGMAFGVDAQYTTAFGEEMELWLQGEFGTGDNYANMDGTYHPKDAEADDTFEDYEWYTFQYFYVKGLFKVVKDFGIHIGFSQLDPNTDGDDDEMTIITPGVTYWWTKHLRTQVEVQLITEKQGTGNDDLEYTHFVLQKVLLWP